MNIVKFDPEKGGECVKVAEYHIFNSDAWLINFIIILTLLMKSDEKKLFEDIFVVKEFNSSNPFRNVSRVNMFSEYLLSM